MSADGQGVAVAAQGKRPGELVIEARVCGLDECLLRPRGAVSNEDVRCAGGDVRCRVIRTFRWRLDSPEETVFVECARDHRIAVIADGDGAAERIAIFRVRSHQANLLRPFSAGASENVGSAFSSLFVVRAYGHRVPVAA